VQSTADDAEAQADFTPPGANPQAISAAIEANERNKRLLRNMINLLFVGLGIVDAGNQYCKSNSHVYLRVGRIMLSNVLAEEGLGNFYLFKLYWRRARKHVGAAWRLSEACANKSHLKSIH
jgi:hypothetical protein